MLHSVQSTSICEIFRFVLARSFFVAGAGAKPITRGATPATAVPKIRAFGVSLYFATAASDARSIAHEPSLMPEALPAVTVPSVSRSVLISPSPPASYRDADVHRYRKFSDRLFSAESQPEQFRVLKNPAACAAAQRCWVRYENASWSARLTLMFLGHVLGRFRHRVDSVLRLHRWIHEPPAQGRIENFGGTAERRYRLCPSRTARASCFPRRRRSSIPFRRI